MSSENQDYCGDILNSENQKMNIAEQLNLETDNKEITINNDSNSENEIMEFKPIEEVSHSKF